ncbi:MAG: ferritin-like domain-containing protein [Chitinophagaceae bacterium]|nr:MAG: ferritin-like domain-containing protein [Chitinophagaceae bacterium]
MKDTIQPEAAASSRATDATSKNEVQGNDKKQVDEKVGESMLEKFFVNQLKDIYYAEQQLAKALPEIAKACTTEELEDAFRDHLHQTERHIKRLERVFDIIGKEPEGKQCEAMDGLISEANSIISETKKGTMTRDAALIIAAQKVEHYEIASYGGLVQLAVTMDLRRAADLLDKTLAEEEQTDQLLTHIAEGHINVKAEEEGQYSWTKTKQSGNGPTLTM